MAGSVNPSSSINVGAPILPNRFGDLPIFKISLEFFVKTALAQWRNSPIVDVSLELLPTTASAHLPMFKISLEFLDKMTLAQ